MRVLYPTDGRLPAIAAAKLLTAIGDPATIEVTVLHVDEYGNKVVADRVAEEVLGEAVKHLAGAGFAAAIKRAGGGVKHAIEHELVAGEHELVAMGTGNTGWLGGFVLGGVSTFVLHRSSVPTLVAHRPPNEGRDGVRVVVGTDGSAAARLGIDTLIALARPDRCDIFVRSVVEPSSPSRWASRRRRSRRPMRSAARWMTRPRMLIGSFGRRSSDSLMPASDVTAMSSVDQPRSLSSTPCTIVTPTSSWSEPRGRGRFAAVTLGSVSAHLVRAAPATLVAPAPGTDNDDG